MEGNDNLKGGFSECPKRDGYAIVYITYRIPIHFLEGQY